MLTRKQALEEFYSSDSPEVWKRILGDELHYHFGHFVSAETSLEEALRQTVRNFFDEIPQGSRILDAGCGWGGPAKLIEKERICTVTGITISAAQYRYCETIGLNTILGDLETMELPQQRFDITLMMESLGHIQNKEAVLQKIRSVSKKLLLRVNCVSDLRHTIWSKPSAWLGYPETPEMIIRRLQRTGWQVKSAVNRIADSNLTQVHWLQRLNETFGSSLPTGHLSLLKELCDGTLKDLKGWNQNNPLMDIVAE